MKTNTFEEYLSMKHAEQYTGVDDDMPDNFDNWLEQFDVMDILQMVKDYEQFQYDQLGEMLNEQYKEDIRQEAKV